MWGVFSCYGLTICSRPSSFFNLNELAIVKPETVIRWHRQGFRLYWTWKSKGAPVGRRVLPPEVRDLIRKMSLANSLWGAVITKNSVRSENTEVPIIREILVATTMSPLFVALFALVASSFRTRAVLQTVTRSTPKIRSCSSLASGL
jgi:hypothetical protein